mmetsp:Transcript_111412/g.315422  ORF Transcript_111412/g.315422 Transcript_111412/m.315422 type:complete len:324 (+) Transcript_111412:67-1038(+)
MSYGGAVGGYPQASSFCGGYQAQCCNCCGYQAPPSRGYNGRDWEEYLGTPEGQNLYNWWAGWVPTPDGQAWCANKRREARRVVDGMIAKWGMHALCAGEGVVDVGGDPGFLAAELLASGIHVTVVDPAFGCSGKADAWTSAYINDPGHQHSVRPGVAPLRVVRECFDESVVQNPAYADIFRGASVIAAFYPDEATEFVLRYSAATATRTVVIPCNECKQFFPPHEPTYEGFVKQLLLNDSYNVRRFNSNAPLQRECLWDTPFCQVLLQRSPWTDADVAAHRGNKGPPGRWEATDASEGERWSPGGGPVRGGRSRQTSDGMACY